MQFKFNLSFDNDIFNFEIKELAKSSCIQKKKTPSQIRREARRREEVKLKHSKKNSEATDKSFKAVETQKTKAPTEFKCNQCEYEKPSEKGLAQHIIMKHCPWLELRCSKQEHIALICVL